MKGWIWILLGILGIGFIVVYRNRYKWGLMKKEDKKEEEVTYSNVDEFSNLRKR